LGSGLCGIGPRPVRGSVGAGEDAEHARRGFRARGIDRDDARVRMGAKPDHRRAGLSIEMEVVAEAAAPGDEPRHPPLHAQRGLPIHWKLAGSMRMLLSFIAVFAYLPLRGRVDGTARLYNQRVYGF
jgi:hypothetical protein